MRTIAALVLFLNLYGLSAQELYFPNSIKHEWETVSAQEGGWSEKGLDMLSKYLEESDSKAFILLQNGKIVAEHYYQDFGKDSIYYWASAGKTLTAFLTGIAIEKGYMDLEDPVSDYLGEGWSACEPEDEAKRKLIHHLTMTSGHDDTGEFGCTKPECLLCIAEPGNRWAYHQGAYTLITYMLENNGMYSNINMMLNSEIGQTTGITAAYIKLGDNRIVFSTPRDFAAFGLLMLGQGDWDGQTILADKNYIADMTRPSQSLNESYGYLTWVNRGESYMLPQSQLVFPSRIAPALPLGTYAGIGANGQIVCVIPEWNTVFVRMGEMSGSGFAPVNFFAEIGELLAAARVNTSVSNNPENTQPFKIINGWAETEDGVRLQLIDVCGRVTQEGMRIELQRGINFIICGGRMYKVGS
jgi:CubicO group peptidase (beta-lactamase class C family)